MNEGTGKFSLEFDPDAYELKEKEIEYKDQVYKVSYREYTMVTYCAEPINPDYQSMDILAPISVNGEEVDLDSAPILLSNSIQAYCSYNIRLHEAGMPRPDMPKGPPPGGRGHGGPNDGTRQSAFSHEVRNYYPLTQGIVIVRPGARGRDLISPDGKHYGKAPAAIVDLKAAVRYIRHNAGVFPGNAERIISRGGSAGGAMSAILGTSGNSSLYDEYLREIGAADERDDIYAAACFCPITDLSHADMAYEWMFGDVESAHGYKADHVLSAGLAEQYSSYIDSLELSGHDGEPLTSENLKNYILREYMIPSCEKYLSEAPDGEREKYLGENPWIEWDGSEVSFTVEDFLRHVGRLKQMGSFDSEGEISLFGGEDDPGKHFTVFGLKEDGTEGVPDSEVKTQERLLNAMDSLRERDGEPAGHWFIRVGSKDGHTSFSVSCLLAATLENSGFDTDLGYLWDFGHNADDDPDDLASWIRRII